MKRLGILNLPPSKRVVIGRNITLTAGAIYALSRFLYYATVNPAELSPAQDLFTLNGHIIGVWTGVWFAAAVFCVVDMINRHTRHGLSAVAAIAFGWGMGYLLVWVFTGFTDFSLFSSAISWLTPAGLAFGLLLKVTALQDMLKMAADLRRAND